MNGSSVLLDAENATTLFGASINATKDDSSYLYPLELVIPITVVYGVIFVTGVVGNVSTCIVIARNKSMHTATNYYLFSLAISDMLLLVSGLPPEMYRIWSPETYVFGEAFCVLQGFAAETSANATVLTITAFTVERYFAICHPFLSHTMSKLSRAVRYIIAIWVVALCLAAPQAIQFGVEYEFKNGTQCSRCTVVSNFFEHAFEISTFLFFVGPMTLITVLYVLIGIQLRKSRTIALKRGPSICSSAANDQGKSRNAAAQNRVVNMLIAVVAAFFICWAPFHAQRLLAVYLANASQEAQQTTLTIYQILLHASGILYFFSTTVNPVLYHIMSNKFREAFKKTFSNVCKSKRGRRSTRPTYSVLSRCPPSMRNLQRSISDGVQKQSDLALNLHNTNNGNASSMMVDHNFLEYGKARQDLPFRPRVLSESSQATALSTLSKTVATTHENAVSAPRKEVEDFFDQNCRYLGSFRMQMFRLFHKKPSSAATIATSARKSHHSGGKFLRQGSVDSSNTISNSSLQDVDEIDYSSSDLVRYMEEINEDIA